MSSPKPCVGVAAPRRGGAARGGQRAVELEGVDADAADRCDGHQRSTSRARVNSALIAFIEVVLAS